MQRRADLHVHTTASDGALTPTQMVEAASAAGLAAVGIADHDTVDGIAEALEAGKRFGIEVVPAIEISAVEDHTEVHILGYFVDHRHPGLVERMRVLKESRRERGRLMVERLNAIGVPVDFARVEEIAQGGAVGRPHVARAICEIDAASSIDAAFGKYLQVGAPAYVPRVKVTPVEAIRIVQEAEGVPCCAHVGKLKCDGLILDLMRHGLAAIEVYHPDHGAAATRFYERFAEQHGLLATGGSDAHCIPGTNSPWVGGVTVDYIVVDRLRSCAARHRGSL
ncbi:MAG: PHP domain-containing protein [Armatimonadota bacterium]